MFEGRTKARYPPPDEQNHKHSIAGEKTRRILSIAADVLLSLLFNQFVFFICLHIHIRSHSRADHVEVIDFRNVDLSNVVLVSVLQG